MIQRASPMPKTFALTDPRWPDVLAALEAEPCSAYVLAPDLSLSYVNKAWSAFARSNGAPALADAWRTLGPIQRLVDRADLQAFFTARLRGALTRDREWSHTYECSSPYACRTFHQRATAGPGRQGIVVVHSLVAESPRDSHATDVLKLEFTDDRGLIVRCAACGRTARPGQRDAWEWAPGLDAQPNISTGICSICSVQEYGLPLKGRAAT